MKKLLRRIAQDIPNSAGIYNTQKGYLEWKDTSEMVASEVLVSLTSNCIKKPVKMMAYALGLSGWYIEEE